ncbi:MAG: tail fiber protein [Sphingopyxis sp.]|nr:tail fiber protein [Sphingopyxis sp.]
MKRWVRRALATLACSTGVAVAAPSMAQTPYIGDIILVPYNFCPRNYVEADGRLQSIAQNTALFSLYGTNYGGDGQTTFAIPDLRGRFSNSAGQGPGLSNYVIGQKAGTESTTLTSNNLPPHTHAGALRAAALNANATTPGNNFPAVSPGISAYQTAAGANYFNAAMAQVSPSGGNQPVDIMPPFLALRPCVALFGIFPSRN